jgi:hypothetical protein
VTSPAFRAVAAAVATACQVPQPRRPAGAVDWPELVRLVARHKVAPLVERSGWLEQAGAPADARAAVADRARAHTVKTLRTLALQHEVLAALTDAGLEHLVLKGLVVAVDGYADPFARHAGDLDLLVRPDGVARAVRVLEDRGFAWYGWRGPEEEDRPPPGRDVLARPERHPLLRDVTLMRDDLHVELHWRLFENPRLMPVDPGWLAAPRMVDLQRGAVPAMPRAAHFTYVLVHGSRHQWSWMKWLADVAALAVRRQELVRLDALAAASAGHERSVATGLLVAEATFGPFLPSPTRAWASGVTGARPLVRSSLRALTAELDRPRTTSLRAMPAEVRARLALRQDAAYRREEVRLLLLTAAHAQAVDDPGPGELIAGPLRWARRAASKKRR